MKPTPGPYRYRDNIACACRIRGGYVLDPTGRRLADVNAFPMGSQDECDANGKLFAAAPDLLAACQAVLARLDNPLLDTSLFSDSKAMVRNALTKAGVKLVDAIRKANEPKGEGK